jgi:predicted RNA-binding Zn ribbon-like protein
VRRVRHPTELVLPDEPAPVRLMNTLWADRLGVHDALIDVDDLRAFLTSASAACAPGATAEHVAAARRLRDALRRLAATVTADDRPRAATDLEEADAVDTVNAAMTGAPNHQVLRRTGGDGWELVRADDDTVDAALGALAREGAELIADPQRRLRACHAPGCVLYFVRDHPRREWCTVTCGNRARAARHYRRLRAANT